MQMAASYGAPGVYVEEMASGSMPVEGVGTAVAAFVGFTAVYNSDNGDPTDSEGVRPQLVTSWEQYERIYGTYRAGAMLPHAVNGFFANGGTKAFIVRIPDGEGEAGPLRVIVPSETRPDVESLRIEGVDPGRRLEIAIERTATAEEGAEPTQEFTLRVLENGQQVEEYLNLNMGRGARSPERAITSERIRVATPAAAGISAVERLPVSGTFPLEPQDAVAVDVGPTELQGSVSERTGYQGLAIADEVTMVAIPDLVTVATDTDGRLDMDTYLAVQSQLVDWCETSGTRMAILDAPPGLNATAAMEWRTNLASSSAYGAAYYPHLVISNPLPRNGSTNRDKFITVPPCGHVAGVWARTDSVRGVWKAPANEVVRSLLRLETDVTTGEQDLLNPEGINCIRSFGGNGLRIWGARTLATQARPDWRYINVRRLFIFVEESIRRGTQWAVFEPNDFDLWQRVKRTIASFLRNLWRQGALVGATAEQAFYVKCDETNNPQDSVDAGRLIVEVGICPVKPAEFVIFRISQWQGGTETTE
jgi:phage tail sheath protein FI